METGMIIIATVLFAIILVPIILLILSTKKQTRTLYKGLTTAVSQNNGVLSEHKEERNFALGLDAQNKFIYYYKNIKGEEITQFVDLLNVTSCEVEKRTKRVKSDKGNYEIVESVALLFYKAQGHLLDKIELYNDEDSMQLNGELVVAEDYKRKVMALLSNAMNISEEKKVKQFTTAVA